MDLSVAPEAIIISESFPPECGDFIILSSDGVRFHFPPFLLKHSSRVFRDMFAVGKAAPNKPLEVEQESNVIDQFLCHLDPVRVKPDIDSTSIAQLLEAARFYQVPSIIRWFEDAIFIEHRGIRSNNRGAFIVECPLLVLQLSLQLGLKECFQKAMHELVYGHISKWNEDVDIPYKVARHCRMLRDARTKDYTDLIANLTGYEFSNSGNIKDRDQQVCMSCSNDRAEWIRLLSMTATDHPSWNVFKTAYESPSRCFACQLSWPVHKDKPWQRWRARVHPGATESAAIAIPDWIDELLERNRDLTPTTEQ